jgi:hypothetical protein
VYVKVWSFFVSKLFVIYQYGSVRNADLLQHSIILQMIQVFGEDYAIRNGGYVM